MTSVFTDVWSLQGGGGGGTSTMSTLVPGGGRSVTVTGGHRVESTRKPSTVRKRGVSDPLQTLYPNPNRSNHTSPIETSSLAGPYGHVGPVSRVLRTLIVLGTSSTGTPTLSRELPNRIRVPLLPLKKGRTGKGGCVGVQLDRMGSTICPNCPKY